MVACEVLENNGIKEHNERRSITIYSDRVILVEGKDDECFFRAISKHIGIDNIQIISINGIKQLRSMLRTLHLTPGFTEVVTLGIIRDADADPKRAIQSIQDALRDSNFVVPSNPLEKEPGNPSLVFSVMPNNTSPGMLEDLCLSSVCEQPEMFCVDNYFQCLEYKGLKYHIGNHFSKAKLSVYLASKVDPTKRFSEASFAGYWEFDKEVFEEVKEFVKLVAS